MLPRLHTIALLMLVAGLALGVFATRALRALGPGEPDPGLEAGDSSRIEQLVDMHRREYDLTPQQADRVRRELLRHDRAVRDKLLELRQRHANDFEALRLTAEGNLRRILLEAEEANRR